MSEAEQANPAGWPAAGGQWSRLWAVGGSSGRSRGSRADRRHLAIDAGELGALHSKYEQPPVVRVSGWVLEPWATRRTTNAHGHNTDTEKRVILDPLPGIQVNTVSCDPLTFSFATCRRRRTGATAKHDTGCRGPCLLRIASRGL